METQEEQKKQKNQETFWYIGGSEPAITGGSWDEPFCLNIMEPLNDKTTLMSFVMSRD